MRYEINGVKYRLQFEYFEGYDRKGQLSTGTSVVIYDCTIPDAEVEVAVAEVLPPATIRFTKDGGRKAALAKAIPQLYSRDQIDLRRAVWAGYFSRLPGTVSNPGLLSCTQLRVAA